MSGGPSRVDSLVAVDRHGGYTDVRGSAFQLWSRKHFVTAAHCVYGVPIEIIRIPNPFGSDLRCISVTFHGRADVAVLETTEEFRWPYTPFDLSSGDPPVGVLMGVRGAVVSVPHLREPPLYRVISGLSQRAFEHEDHRWVSPALELGVAIPIGMSGGPVCFLNHPNTVVGMAIGSLRSEIVESAVEEVQTDGVHHRESIKQITVYGVALHLVRLTEWLQEVIPGYPHG